jgi:uncharacterized protein (DUF1697 family)
MATFIALLRGINVGGHMQVPMAELRALCTALGLSDVSTYIQSGNLIFSSPDTPARLEPRLEAAVAERFGFPVDIVVRAARDWPAIIKGNPFIAASEKEPQLVYMLLAKRTLHAGAAAALRERARDGEVIASVGEALWIHYPNGSARSKLSPSLIDRLVGSPATARNYRTTLKLGELAGC